MNGLAVKRALAALASAEKQQQLQRYFKTGPDNMARATFL